MANMDRRIPAQIQDEQTNLIKEYTVKAFKSLNSKGVVRIDYIIDNDTNKVYINEINTIPGSLSFYLWEKTNKDYPELLDDIINLGIVNYKERSRKTTTFKSNILEGFSGSKGVKGIKK
jgi:D-alanine-D-alanine ligase